jgi:ribosomal protein S18 acetylase RimI-like enzyme
MSGPDAAREALRVVEARTSDQVAAVRELLLEYQASLGIDLGFQGFAHELETLPGDYAPPGGELFVATAGEAVLGCIALRRLAPNRCEMKRLYVRPAGRGRGVGRAQAAAAIDRARVLGYAQMLLDTLPTQGAAQAMYEGLGFVDVAPYRANPVAGSRFLALDLTARSGG